MLRLGHRGTPLLHPENTMAGFKEALAQGLNGIEFDVQVTRDGHLVVYHDEVLSSGAAIWRMSLAELKEQVPYIVLLDELLDWAEHQRYFFLNLELKNSHNQNDGREKLLLAKLQNYNFDGRLVISCFNPFSLWRIYRLSKRYALGFLYNKESLYWLAPLMQILPIYSLHPHFSMVTPAYMKKAHARGKKVFAWTVNTPTEVNRLTSLKTDALIGDIPNVLKGE